MAALTKKKTAELRKALLLDRESLLGQASGFDEQERELTAARMSPEERTRNEGEGDQLAVERDLIAQLGDKSRAALVEVDAALARIDAGTYGLCSGCGKPVPVERLEARPEAATCVPCASARR